MDRFERLIDLGLSVDESTILTTPARELGLEGVKTAFYVLDIRNELVRKENNSFVSTSSGGVQIINKDGFEAFQSPVDTNVIISSERQRQDEMKRHGCIDAREMIPHGKTSLLDGQL